MDGNRFSLLSVTPPAGRGFPQNVMEFFARRTIIYANEVEHCDSKGEIGQRVVLILEHRYIPRKLDVVSIFRLL